MPERPVTRGRASPLPAVPLPQSGAPMAEASRSRPLRVTRAVDDYRRMESIATTSEQREVKCLVTRMYRDDIRARGDTQRNLVSRERKLRNAIASSTVKAQQLQMREELQRLTQQREEAFSAKMEEADRSRAQRLRQAVARLHNRRKFFNLRRDEARALMEEERQLTLAELQNMALDDVASVARQRSVKMILARENMAHESPIVSPVNSPPMSPTEGRPVDRSGLPHTAAAQRPESRHPLPGHPSSRPPASTMSSLVRRSPDSPLVRVVSPANVRRAGTPGARLTDSLLGRGPKPHIRTPAVEDMAKVRKRFIATALAKQAIDEHRQYRNDRNRVTRSLTPGVGGGGGAVLTRGPGTEKSPIHSAVGSQSAVARQHARTWQRLFGRFHDVLNGAPSPDADDVGWERVDEVAGSSPPAGHESFDDMGTGPGFVDGGDDPVVTNESRPATRCSHTRGGAPAEPTPGASIADDFFSGGGNFEALYAAPDENDGDAAGAGGEAHTGLGATSPDGAEADGLGLSSSSSSSSLPDLADDTSDISDERLRQVVDGSSTPGSDAASGGEPASKGGEDPEAAAAPRRAEAAARPALDETSAARRLQHWARGAWLPVARRRQIVRDRRSLLVAEALADALRIVRQEHAAGTIQRAWRRQH